MKEDADVTVFWLFTLGCLVLFQGIVLLNFRSIACEIENKSHIIDAPEVKIKIHLLQPATMTNITGPTMTNTTGQRRRVRRNYWHIISISYCGFFQAGREAEEEEIFEIELR